MAVRALGGNKVRRGGKMKHAQEGRPARVDEKNDRSGTIAFAESPQTRGRPADQQREGGGFGNGRHARRTDVIIDRVECAIDAHLA